MQLSGDAVEDAADVATHEGQRDDSDDTYQRHDKAVFDQSLALLLVFGCKSGDKGRYEAVKHSLF